ncbi:MAG TPA: ectonucleotide pyrophosphatase/phosphodiesterase [Vicinamibacterales bacterium]|nr:ectonucleotide pyrophosphatase/phosphodiesterase [Vicinamibacterales bacterium]
MSSPRDLRRRLPLISALCLWLLGGAWLLAQRAPQPPAVASHVVLISIDGLKPDYYLGRGPNPPHTPVLDALKARGTYAEGVIAQYPSLTYVGHTSIATGDRPVRHGIVENTLFDPEHGSNAWVFDASAIKVPALWDVAGAAGLTTAGASWPVTVGAHMTYLFPESNQGPRGRTWLEEARQDSTPGLVDAVVRRLGGFGGNDNRDPVQRDRFTTAASTYMMETWRPNLLMVHLVEADFAQHAHGPWSPEARTAMEHIDARIGEILQTVERAGILEQTDVIVTGDHGFYRVHSAFQPNVVLKRAGLLETDAQGRIVAWQAVAHRAGIRLKNPSDAALAKRVERLFQGLADGPYQGLLRIVGRDEIARLGGDPNLLLMLEPVEGYTTDARTTGDVLVAAGKGGDHGYLPTEPQMFTGLIMAGPGIRRGLVLPIARQIDIAPTAARLLGVEMRNTDGVEMVGVLDQQRRSEAGSAPRR